MGIRAFQESDIEAAGQMAHDIWAHELEGTRPELNRFIHEYLVRYYDVNRHLSFSVVDDGLDAFLLAGLKADRSGCDGWFCRKLSFFPDKEKKIAQEYRNYLTRNGDAVKKFMGENDVQMGLFMSRVSGTGRMLLDNLERICRKNGVENLFLWADVTCNVPYYEKNGFIVVDRFENDVSLDTGCLDTYVFRKKLD